MSSASDRSEVSGSRRKSRPGPILLHEAEVWVVRDAVKAVMESCAVTPNCDVHEER